MRVTYVGHATVLLELGGARVLTDPVLRRRLLHLRRHGPLPAPVGALDAVLVSHLHHDHLDPPSLRGLRPRPVAVVPRGAGALLRRLGFASLRELVAGESVAVGPLTVTAVPAVHDGRRYPRFGPTADAIGYVLEAGGRRAYFAGDTDLFDGMAALGPLDLALLPVWGWGPTAGRGHLDPESAAEAVARIRPRVAVPIHWGTLYPAGRLRAMGRLMTDPPHRFAAAVAERAPGVEVRVLQPGGVTEL